MRLFGRLIVGVIDAYNKSICGVFQVWYFVWMLLIWRLLGAIPTCYISKHILKEIGFFGPLVSWCRVAHIISSLPSKVKKLVAGELGVVLEIDLTIPEGPWDWYKHSIRSIVILYLQTILKISLLNEISYESMREALRWLLIARTSRIIQMKNQAPTGNC